MASSISVILPAFNEEKRIGRCIEALRLQTLRDFECITVDDGSTDSTAEAFERAVQGDQRFRLIRTEHRGLSAARNVGLDAALGDIIFYADADDIPGRNFLLEPTKFLERNGLDIVLFDASLRNEGISLSRWIAECRYYRRNRSCGICSGREMFCRMAESHSYIAPVYLQAARRNAVRFRFEEGMLYEDEPYTFRNLLSAERAGHLNRKLYERVCRPGSIVNSERGMLHSFSRWRCARMMLEFAESLEPRLGEKAMELAENLARMHLFLAAKALKDVPDGGKAFLQSVTEADRQRYLRDVQKAFRHPYWRKYPVEPA